MFASVNKLFGRQFFSRNKRMIAGNWKSNFTQQQALAFVRDTVQPLTYNAQNVGKSQKIFRRYHFSYLTPYSFYSST